MSHFTADLHIHSRFSRATSKQLTPSHLAAWARIKGIDVLGTGDFTHPEWLAEIEEQMEEDSSGLLVLKDESGIPGEAPWLAGPLEGKTRFMLQGEISSIYKKKGKVRKIHNLVFMPTIEAAKAFNTRLAKVGNLASDGRPILGLDSRDLLEMVLETDPQAHLVPAHIWTPWFSLFGSKSGFDSLRECFGDLASHIFAVETGLSSDPEMNWMWSELDRLKLISNSDAHSGDKLARELNLFSGRPSYEGVFRALRDEGLSHKFLGTVEFFPEEGKYHLDGHRKCNVVLEPEESRMRGGLCPVCGKPVTEGVLSRIMELADRDAPLKPNHHPGFCSLIPLCEVLSEILGKGPRTKAVREVYAGLISRFGSELAVLRDVPPEEAVRHSPPLGEALARMRRGQVIRQGGFDGQYGVIRVFTPKEQAEIRGGGTLVSLAVDARAPGAPVVLRRNAPKTPEPERTVEYNEAQKRAIEAGPGPVLVLAGPGTGKTQTLMGRVERLLDQGADPDDILILTFTRRAAKELRQRLKRLRGESARLPHADTLHGLAFDYWVHTHDGKPPVLMNENTALRLFTEVNPELTGSRLKETWAAFNLDRENLLSRFEINGKYGDCAKRYIKKVDSWDLVDYTMLLEIWLEQLADDKTVTLPGHVLVDEVQDLSRLQLRVITELAGSEGKNFFAIGDPKQSIYGFRGAAGDVESRLRNQWGDLETVTLSDNYRSGQTILDAAHSLFPDSPALAAHLPEPGEIHLFQAPDPGKEAAWIGGKVKSLLGATSHSLLDGGEEGGLAPGDIAVLVRIKALIPTILSGLERMGIPASFPAAEPFWADPRVDLVIRTAGRILGLAEDPDENLDVPPHILTKGPKAMAAYLKDMPPFDRLFWEGPEFRAMSRKHDALGGWIGLINWVNLQSDLETVSEKAEKVQIMSLHAAKGLEFDAVFLAGLEDGLIPFAGADILSGKIRTDAALADVDEERRLFYVGLTRAKSRLYLSGCTKRRLFGRSQMLPPCRFIKAIPENLFTKSALVAKTVKKEKTLSLLD